MGNYTSKADEEFFGAIGRLTISWGHLELGIDGIVEIFYYGFRGKEFEPQIPRTLSRKISFMRAVIKKLPIGEEAISGFMSFLDKVDAASKLRHEIIHGVVIEHAEGSGEAVLVKLTRNKHGVTKRHFKATTVSILQAANEAQKLGSKMLWWLTEMQKLIEELFRQGNGQPLS